MADAAPSILERCYTVTEIAEKWKLSYKTVKRIFENEEGVIRYGEGSRLVGGQKKKYTRRFISLRIPESVLVQVQDRLMHKRRPAGEDHVRSAGVDRDLHAAG
jgi:hypothetical protein